MFKHKYVAINQLTGIEVKRFRTLGGAKRWMAKPMTLIGIEVSKWQMFIRVYEITDLEKTLTVNESRDAFQVMANYARADTELTTELFEGFVQPYNPEIDDEVPLRWCEICGVDHSQDGVELYEQPTLPDMPQEPKPHWERVLLGSLDVEPGELPAYCPNDCEDCDNLKAQREAEAVAESDSDDALRTLRNILGAEVIEEEPEVVLISVSDRIFNLPTELRHDWLDDGRDFDDNLVMQDKHRLLVHNYSGLDDTSPRTGMFYQLTPEAVEKLGEFKPVEIEEPIVSLAKGINERLADMGHVVDEDGFCPGCDAETLSNQQAQQFAEGLAQGAIEKEVTKASEQNGVNPSA